MCGNDGNARRSKKARLIRAFFAQKYGANGTAAELATRFLSEIRGMYVEMASFLIANNNTVPNQWSVVRAQRQKPNRIERN